MTAPSSPPGHGLPDPRPLPAAPQSQLSSGDFSQGQLPQIQPGTRPGLLPLVDSKPIGSSSQGKQPNGQPSEMFSTGNSGLSSSPEQTIPWSFSAPRGAIGIEREILIHLRPERIEVNNELDLSVPEDVTADQLQRAVTRTVAQHVQTWKPAPQSFFWKPAVKIVIHPGGNQHYARIKDLATTWGSHVTTEYTLQ